MAMYSCADLKKGLKLMIDGEPHVIVAFDFTKPGKGQALYKCKLRNMITGSLFERTYRSGESFEPAQPGGPRHAVPLPGRRRLCLHGQQDLRADHAHRRDPG